MGSVPANFTCIAVGVEKSLSKFNRLLICFMLVLSQIYNPLQLLSISMAVNVAISNLVRMDSWNGYFLYRLSL